MWPPSREEERQRELERQQRELEKLEREKREAEASEMRRKVRAHNIYVYITQEMKRSPENCNSPKL